MDISFGELHPLENSLVLQSIFEQCTLKDLKSCRLVSRLWRDSSRTTWRSSVVVILDPTVARRSMSDFQLFSNNYNPHQGDIQQVPFINYHLRTEDSAWFYNFWGSSIKVLTLESVKFSQTVFLKTVKVLTLKFVDFESGDTFLKTIFNCCKNLEKLDLIGVTVGENGGINKPIEQIDWKSIQENTKLMSLVLNGFRWNGVVWMEVLNRVPSLQALSLADWFSPSSFKDLFQSLAMIRERNPTKLKLKLIDLENLIDVPPTVVPVLLDLNLHLKTLVLGPAFLHKFGYRLMDILDVDTRQSSPLKRLGLFGNSEAVIPKIFQNQRQLENLQELHIESYLSKDYLLANFFKMAPNLRKIAFRGFSPNNTTGVIKGIYEMQAIKLNLCTELDLGFTRLSEQDLEHLISWMPNLRKLKIYQVNNQKFQMICVGWSNLVTLDVWWCEISDSGLTGLDDEDVKKVNTNGTNGVWRPITVPRANISCLRYLQRLVLFSGPRPVGIDLGVCAVVCGIELLSNLKHVKIDLSDMGVKTKALWKSVGTRYPWPEDEN